MTLSDLITEFNSRSDDTVDTSKITNWINQSYQTDIVGFSEQWPWMKNTSTLTLTNGSASLPSALS